MIAHLLHRFKLPVLFTFLNFILFSQLNAQISTFPHFSDFEAEALCGTFCGPPCDLTGDWKNANQYALPAAGTQWRSEDGSTPSSATGPDTDHTLGNGAGKYLYVETSGCNNLTADLISNQYDFTNLVTPAIEFWYHLFGATMGTIQVDVSTDGGMSFDNVEAPFTDNENLWQYIRISLIDYAGMPDVRIRIRATTGSSFTSDMAIDDIEVYDCNIPEISLSNLRLASGNCYFTNSESISITIRNTGCIPISAGTSIEMSYTLNAGSPIIENLILAADLLPAATVDYIFSATTNLTGTGDQTIEVSADMTGNATGVLTLSRVFFSGINTFPYTEDYENGAGGWMIDPAIAFLDNWALGTPAKPTINSAHSGNNAWVTGLSDPYSNSQQGAVNSPCFDLRNLLDAQISMWVWWNCEFSWDGAVLQSSTDGGASWQNIGDFGDPNNWYTDNTIVGNPGGSQTGWSGRNSSDNGSGGWVLAQHDISHLVGLSPVYFRVAFGTDGSVVDDGFAFDDISIDGTCITADADNDGYTICNGDCDDNDDTVYPGAPELCDNKDNDCNSMVDDGISCDEDGDGYTVAQGDCDDTNPDLSPGTAPAQSNVVYHNLNSVTVYWSTVAGSTNYGIRYRLAGSSDPWIEATSLRAWRRLYSLAACTSYEVQFRNFKNGQWNCWSVNYYFTTPCAKTFGTGKNNDDLSAGMQVFPNPTSDILNIVLDENMLDKAVTLTLSDQLGRDVWSRNIQNLETTLVELNVREYQLAAGVYMLSLQSENSVTTTQIVVNR